MVILNPQREAYTPLIRRARAALYHAGVCRQEPFPGLAAFSARERYLGPGGSR